MGPSAVGAYHTETGHLRVFFFQPVLAGKTDGEKSDHVGSELIDRAGPATYKE